MVQRGRVHRERLGGRDLFMVEGKYTVGARPGKMKRLRVNQLARISDLDCSAVLFGDKEE